MDIVDQLKYAGDHVLFEPHLYHSAADEIERLRLANSDLQMYYDYAKTECDKLQIEVLKLREELNELRLSYEIVVDALKEKE